MPDNRRFCYLFGHINHILESSCVCTIFINHMSLIGFIISYGIDISFVQVPEVKVVFFGTVKVRDLWNDMLQLLKILHLVMLFRDR